jgi:ribosome-binding protein aMBF1 (putative translation factor)
MQHIKSYFNKIENILSSRKSSSSKKAKPSKGFVSQDKKMEQPMGSKDSVELIADYIEGIREARDELMKAKK